jgi:Kdo2-lipid IVA lauroyltransferase/acyltransferase
MSTPSPATPGKRRASLAIGLLSRLPLPLLYRLSDLLFVLLFHLARFQRQLLADNLRRAFPGKPAQEINRLAAATYRNALDFLFETIKAWRFGAQDLQQRIEIENADLLTALLKQHKTVLALTAHSGNWEWLQLTCGARLDAPIAAVYNPLNHRGVDALLLQLRTRFGSRLIDNNDNALPALIEFSRQGGIIALNADQGPRAEDDKYWTAFLGTETAFFTGPEKLARLFQAPVVFVAMQRLRRGYYRVRFELLATPPYPSSPGAVLQPYVQALEQQIRAAPQDWFWLYKRWKYEKSLYAG